MPSENGFRKQTREDSNKTHLTREDSNKTQLLGRADGPAGMGGVAPLAPRSVGLDTPSQQAVPAGRPSADSQGGTATTLPSSAPPHTGGVRAVRASQQFPWPRPSRGFGLVVCAQSSLATHVDRNGCCRNKTNPLTLQCSLIMAHTGLCVPGHRGTESEGHASSSQHSPVSRRSEQHPGVGQAHGIGILALAISSCEILCKTPSSVCSGEKPRPQSPLSHFTASAGGQPLSTSCEVEKANKKPTPPSSRKPC